MRLPTLLFLILFTGTSLALEEVTPSPGSVCSRYETCATKSSCDHWVEKENSVKNLPRSSSQFRQFLSEARAAICNRGRNALCCPQVKPDNLVEKNPSPGSNCDSGEVCATKKSCLYWENREKSVKNLPRSDSRFQQYVSAARGAICNRKEGALCCPIDVDTKSPKTAPRQETTRRPTSRPSVNPEKESPSYIPKSGECGANPDASNIFGGEKTKPGEFPFTVLLGITKKRRGPNIGQGWVDYTQWVCGGTLINQWYVVTAGHCVKGGDAISMVRAGEYKVKDEFHGRKPTPGLPDIQEFKISKADIMVHERYKVKRGNIENDIALIRLPRKVSINSQTQIACLPLPGNSSFVGLRSNWKDDSVGEEATVVGWGYSCYEEGTRSFCKGNPNLPDFIPTKDQQKLVVR